MTDTHELTGLPATVRDLTLDVTGLAQTVCIVATIRPLLDSEADAMRLGLVTAWETLTGLSGDAALDAAQAITRHPLPVTAAVVPF